MTTQYKRQLDNDPDDPDDSSSMDGHHVRMKIKYLTHTHPLKQRIEINTSIDPIVVIGLSLITTGVTMGGVSRTVAMICPLTRPAC